MKVNSKSLVLFLLGIILIPCFISAQENLDVLTLERIYKDNDFILNYFGPAIWLEDGSGYTTLEKSNDFSKAKDIIKYIPKSGKRSILVNATKLIPQNEKKPVPVLLLIQDKSLSN